MSNQWTDKNTWVGLASTVGAGMALCLLTIFLATGATNWPILVISSIASLSIFMGIPFLLLYKKATLTESIAFSWLFFIFIIIIFVFYSAIGFEKHLSYGISIIVDIIIASIPSILAFYTGNLLLKNKNKQTNKTIPTQPESTDR